MKIILQQDCGYGFEDIEVFEFDTELSESDKKEIERLVLEYQIAQPKASLRLISIVKMPNNETKKEANLR